MRVRLRFLKLGVILLGVSFQLGAQGPALYPLSHNQSSKISEQSLSLATVQLDTLDLPFFDDFAYSGPSPDFRLWCDNNVFINNTFSKNQITQGMATFDHLDSNGRPYNFLSRFAVSGADTLTSQPINLFDRLVSAVLTPYVIEDSIILSFFVETGGLGDTPEGDDSLKLEFKDLNGNWIGQWFINDNVTDSFEQYFIAINNPDFLHNAFQFRFINVTKNSGNMNHFNLDYIQFKEDRISRRVGIGDVSFTLPGPSLFETYSIIPFEHFNINPSSQLRSSRAIQIRNNQDTAVKVDVQAETFEEDNNRIYFEPFASTNLNIGGRKFETVSYPSFTIPAQSQDSTFLRSVFEVRSINNDSTEVNVYKSLHNNNIIEVYNYFNQMYAYDDGSAEAGFGLDYGGLPDGPAFCAMEYNNLKQDTLNGVDIHFNRALEEVGNRPITLMIWQSIADGSGAQDVVIREIQTTPTYVNQKNGFARFELDTTIILDPGKFYVGWRQNTSYIANIGWDKNYSSSGSKIYYNFIGDWVELGSAFEGTLMMRPLLGKKIQPIVSIDDISSNTDFVDVQIFPNPSSGKVNIQSTSDAFIKIVDLQGKLIYNGTLAQGVNPIHIKQKGMYICLINDSSGAFLKSKKLIIE